MSRYDEFRTSFAQATAEEKLGILRSEAKRLHGMLHGYGSLILHVLEQRIPAELPDDFRDWCQRLVDNSEELHELIDALTDPRHRSILQQEQAQRDQAFREMLWSHQQAGLPELQTYASFTEAVEQTAQRLGLTFTTGMAGEIRRDAFYHPSGFIDFSTRERQARIDAQASQRDGRYLGYVVTVMWLIDPRNYEWQEHEGLSQSLEEAVTVIHRWLIGQWDLAQIQQTYPWMESGTVQRDS